MLVHRKQQLLIEEQREEEHIEAAHFGRLLSAGVNLEWGGGKLQILVRTFAVTTGEGCFSLSLSLSLFLSLSLSLARSLARPLCVHD
jgi:hypothetical protein